MIRPAKNPPICAHHATPPPRSARPSSDAPLEHLPAEPKRHEPKRAQAQRDRDQGNRQEQDLRTRKQRGIGTEDAGNGTGRADRRRRAGGIHLGMGGTRQQDAQHIQQPEPEQPHARLDGTAEHQQRPHIAKQVQPAAMQKGHGDVRRVVERVEPVGGRPIGVVVAQRNQAVDRDRHGRIAPRKRLLPQKYDHARGGQQVGQMTGRGRGAVVPMGSMAAIWWPS